jgi:hypothetical protein
MTGTRKILKFRDKKPYSFLTMGIHYDVLHIILENNVKSGTIVKRSGAPWASDVTYRVVQRF